jgi:hypothetical protein
MILVSSKTQWENVSEEEGLWENLEKDGWVAF